MPVGRRQHKRSHRDIPTESSHDQHEQLAKKKRKEKSIDETIMDRGGKFVNMLLEIIEEEDFKKFLLDEMRKEDGGASYKRQFAKDMISFIKKQYDVVIAKMKIQADRDSDKSALSGGVKPVTTIFVIKGLYEEGGNGARVIDVTDQAVVVGEPKKLQLKGLEE